MSSLFSKVGHHCWKWFPALPSQYTPDLFCSRIWRCSEHSSTHGTLQTPCRSKSGFRFHLIRFIYFYVKSSLTCLKWESPPRWSTPAPCCRICGCSSCTLFQSQSKQTWSRRGSDQILPRRRGLKKKQTTNYRSFLCPSEGGWQRRQFNRDEQNKNICCECWFIINTSSWHFIFIN